MKQMLYLILKIVIHSNPSSLKEWPNIQNMTPFT